MIFIHLAPKINGNQRQNLIWNRNVEILNIFRTANFIEYVINSNCSYVNFCRYINCFVDSAVPLNPQKVQKMAR